MDSSFDLITITPSDLKQYKMGNKRSKISLILQIVLDELPDSYKLASETPITNLIPIEGFEDEVVRGYEVEIKNNKVAEEFVRLYIPFFILKKQ
jgi:hypothetical protein